MKQFTRVFTPTRNRRLNELIGFLLFVSAVLLFLALASYSPQHPSLNTASPPRPWLMRMWHKMDGTSGQKKKGKNTSARANTPTGKCRPGHVGKNGSGPPR